MENSNHESPQPKLPKLVIFKTVRKNFIVAGFSPNLAMQSYPLNGKIYIGFLILGLTAASHLMYIFNDARTFAEYTRSIYVCSLAVLMIPVLMILIFKFAKLCDFIDLCDSIVNTALKYTPTRSIYCETNQFEEKLSKIIFLVMVKLTPVFTLLPWAIYSFFIFVTTDLGSEAFVLPQQMWFPFDSKRPLGYLIAVATQYGMLSYILLIVACLLAFGMGAYLYAIAVSKCIKNSLFSISRNIVAESDPIGILDQITEFFQFHSRVKQMVFAFSDVIQYFVVIVFMWSLVTICGAMLMIQIQLVHDSVNLAELLITLIEAFYAFGVLFIACELGQRFNLAFEECSDIIDQFDWYRLPMEIQRMLPLMLHFTQQPIEIRFFGSAACDRETFKYIIKTASSYFTVLRQFYN